MGKIDFRDRTHEIWSAQYGREITDEEAREIIDNMVAFAEFIIERYMNEKKRDGNRMGSDDGV